MCVGGGVTHWWGSRCGLGALSASLLLACTSVSLSCALCVCLCAARVLHACVCGGGGHALVGVRVSVGCTCVACVLLSCALCSLLSVRFSLRFSCCMRVCVASVACEALLPFTPACILICMYACVCVCVLVLLMLNLWRKRRWRVLNVWWCWQVPKAIMLKLVNALQSHLYQVRTKPLCYELNLYATN